MAAVDREAFSAEELRALVPPPPMTVSEWADAYRTLGPRDGAAEAGPWRTSRTPYLRAIMDAMGDPEREVVVVVKPAQVGGTVAAHNALGYLADRDPGPALIVYPTQESAEKQMRGRIKALVETNPQIAQHLVGERYEVTRLEILLDAMTIRAGWAGAPQALATDPYRYVFLDEIDKYPDYAGDDADPVALAFARTRTYGHRRRVIMVSTPTTDKRGIWRQFERCADRRRLHIECPRCKEPVLVTRDRFRWEGWPEEPTPEEVEARGVWYACQACEGRIEEHERVGAIERGVWLQEPDANGVLVEGARWLGLHFSAFVATIGVTWRGLIAKWLRVKHDVAALMEFVTQELGEPWRDTVTSVKVADAEERSKKGNPRGVVPEWAAGLIATADTQKDYWYWLVRAWGHGDRSQLVDLGKAKTWDELLAATVDRAWPIGSTTERMRPELLMVDVGGGTETDGGGNRTDEVYRYAGRTPDKVLCCKGYTGQGRPARDVVVSYHTYQRAGYAGYKVRVATVDTQRLKDVLASRINAEPAPGKPVLWELCNDLPPEYFEHLSAEHKVAMRKGQTMVERWVIRSHGRRNEALDCEVYQLAAARLVGADRAPPPEEIKQDRERVVETRQMLESQPRQRFTTTDGRPWLANRR